MKEKVNDLVRLYKTMQELKTASYLGKIQIFSLVRYKWSRSTVQNILMSLNILFELHKKSNK